MIKELTIDGNSETYANEKEQFISWMCKNYPEIELIEEGQGYYENNKLIENAPNFWDEYCNFYSDAEMCK